MSFAFRLCCALAVILSLASPVEARPQSSNTNFDSSSGAESAVRAVVESYFALYADRDLDGVMRLWSEKSPELASLEEKLRSGFAKEHRVSWPEFSRFMIEADTARIRAAVTLSVTDLETSERTGQRLVRNFDMVLEEGSWKIIRQSPAHHDLAEALAKTESAVEQTELLSQEKELVTPELVLAIVGQGEAFFGQGSYAKALSTHRTGHEIAAQLGDQTGLARTLNGIGNAHWAQGDYASATRNFQESLALSRTLNDRIAEAGTLRNLGNVEFVQGNWDQAAELFRQGLQLSQSLGDRSGMARGLGSLGVVADSQGSYAQALDFYRQSLDQFRSLEDQTGIARTLGNIAIVYEEQGNYAQALGHHQESLTLFEARGDRGGIARTLHNIAVVHVDQGNYEQALDHSHQSLRMREVLGDRNGMARTLELLANIHDEQGEYTQALEYGRRSLALREELNDKQGIANVLNSIGGIEAARGEYEQAVKNIQQSLAMAEEIGYRRGIASALGFMSSIHQRNGRHAAALEAGDRAAAIAREIGDVDRLSQVRLIAGNAHRALDQQAQARLAFEEAISIIEMLRGQVAGGSRDRQRFFETKVSPYHAMVKLLVDENKPAEALSFAERAKARVLVEVMETGRINVTRTMTSAERERERKLTSQLVSLNTRISRESDRQAPDQTRLKELEAEIRKARLDFEAFQTNLYAAHPELRVQRGATQPLRVEEASALLQDDGTALLEYVVTEDRTYLFVITKTTGRDEPEVRVYTLDIRQEEVARRTEAFRQQLAGRDLGFRAAARELHTLLIEPAQSQLRNRSSFVIVPDGALWDLPFQALLTSANRYLIEDAAIAYVPSLTVMREIAKNRSTRNDGQMSGTLLALGNPLLGKDTVARAKLALRDQKLDPLPEAEQEAKALGKLYGAARSRVYVRAEAREDRAKAESSDAGVLHFATHGVLNNASPMYSHLVLAPGNENEDGILEAWELMQLDLKADLAVLSACETARGRYGAGEGVIGLTWALFVAGVPSTVVSQWKVESASTRDLMVSFHRTINSTSRPQKGSSTKSEALRRAALRLLKDPETSHPFYWAGFVLVGDDK